MNGNWMQCDRHGGGAALWQTAICRVGWFLYISLLHATGTEVGFCPVNPSGWKEACFLTNALCAWGGQRNSPSWLAWRSRGATCCHGAWGCCCPRKQEGGAAADASLPGGKEDEEGLSLALFTVGAVVLELCLEGALVCQAASCCTDGKHNTPAEDNLKNIICSSMFKTTDD